MTANNDEKSILPDNNNEASHDDGHHVDANGSNNKIDDGMNTVHMEATTENTDANQGVTDSHPKLTEDEAWLVLSYRDVTKDNAHYDYSLERATTDDGWVLTGVEKSDKPYRDKDVRSGFLTDGCVFSVNDNRMDGVPMPPVRIAVRLKDGRFMHSAEEMYEQMNLEVESSADSKVSIGIAPPVLMRLDDDEPILAALLLVPSGSCHKTDDVIEVVDPLITYSVTIDTLSISGDNQLPRISINPTASFPVVTNGWEIPAKFEHRRPSEEALSSWLSALDDAMKDILETGEYDSMKLLSAAGPLMEDMGPDEARLFGNMLSNGIQPTNKFGIGSVNIIGSNRNQEDDDVISYVDPVRWKNVFTTEDNSSGLLEALTRTVSMSLDMAKPLHPSYPVEGQCVLVTIDDFMDNTLPVQDVIIMYETDSGPLMPWGVIDPGSYAVMVNHIGSMFNDFVNFIRSKGMEVPTAMIMRSAESNQLVMDFTYDPSMHEDKVPNDDSEMDSDGTKGLMEAVWRSLGGVTEIPRKPDDWWITVIEGEGYNALIEVIAYVSQLLLSHVNYSADALVTHVGVRLDGTNGTTWHDSFYVFGDDAVPKNELTDDDTASSEKACWQSIDGMLLRYLATTGRKSMDIDVYMEKNEIGSAYVAVNRRQFTEPCDSAEEWVDNEEKTFSGKIASMMK